MYLKFDKIHIVLAVYEGEWRKGHFIKGTV